MLENVLKWSTDSDTNLTVVCSDTMIYYADAGCKMVYFTNNTLEVNLDTLMLANALYN